MRGRHVTEPEGAAGVVTAFMVRGQNHSYEVQWDKDSAHWHLEMELVAADVAARQIGWRGHA